jgi:hypothetical protein
MQIDFAEHPRRHHNQAPRMRPEYLVYFDGLGIWKIRYEMRENKVHILDAEEQLIFMPMKHSYTFYNRRSLRTIQGIL